MRMYFFVPYHLSGIQKGIQAGHSALEYANLYANTPEFKYFIQSHKTWIILNGGTTSDLQGVSEALHYYGINFSRFREPDLDNALTSVCFLAPEQVYDREKYPDLAPCKEDEKYAIETIKAWVNSLGGINNVVLRRLITGKHLA